MKLKPTKLSKFAQTYKFDPNPNSPRFNYLDDIKDELKVPAIREIQVKGSFERREFWLKKLFTEYAQKR